jgi:hypothetical protein
MTDTLERSGSPVATFKVGDDLPDLDAGRYQVESTAGHSTAAMDMEQCLIYLGLIPSVDTSYEEEERAETEWNIWPC